MYYFKQIFKKENITHILESNWKVFSISLANLIDNINNESNIQKSDEDIQSPKNFKYDKLPEETAKEFDIVVTEENSSRVRDQSRILHNVKYLFKLAKNHFRKV
jgi:hypothetical protein